MKADSTLAQLVRSHDEDAFLAALFVPSESRGALLTLHALDAELAHVHHKVSEDITAHIRYAWWQEALDEIHAGKPVRKYPLVEALAVMMLAGQLSYTQLSELVHLYRTHYPTMPVSKPILQKAAIGLIQAICPSAEAGWRRANEIINDHRTKYGNRRNGWLKAKLLIAGM